MVELGVPSYKHWTEAIGIVCVVKRKLGVEATSSTVPVRTAAQRIVCGLKGYFIFSVSLVLMRNTREPLSPQSFLLQLEVDGLFFPGVGCFLYTIYLRLASSLILKESQHLYLWS